MNGENLSEMKVSEKMEALKAKILDEVKRDILARGEKLPTEEELNQKITVKYLGKMEFLKEKGELAEKKDVFIVTEQLGGMFENLYYDEDLKLLGVQQMIGKEIYPTEYMLGKIPEKMKGLTEEDIEESKTIEEQKQEEEKQEKLQQLPGLEGPQLTKKQAMSLNGPKVDMNQQVDNVTLATKLGLTGNYIKFVQIDEVRKLIPELDIDELGQQFVPIEIYADGTADIVGEDKLKFSTLEGTNNTNEQTTMNNDGTRRQEQGIVTFDIVGTRNCITVGFDELNTSSPFYEAKFGTRDVEQPSEVLYDELETTHEGPLKQEKEKGFAQINNTEGMYEASKEPVTEQQAEELARARGWYKLDENGNVIGPDIEKATEYLKENSIGDNSVQELIDQARDDAKTREPKTPTSLWE